MIVFRDQRQTFTTAALLARMEAAVAAPAREALIDFGEFEAGVADHFCANADTETTLLHLLRRMSIVAGRALWHQHRGSGDAGNWMRKFRSELFQLHSFALPDTITASVPEGFAYYGLFPETYLEAAADFQREVQPERVAVIGLRGIGAALSAAVAAALEELGCAVDSWTVRPRGHPFYRHLEIAATLESRWRQRAGAYFAIVDEGPGLSGSSMTSVADRVSRMGVPDDRIVLFPSSAPDGGRFLSADARARWPRHRKYVRGFEDLGPPPGLDISAGAWRPLTFAHRDDYPAVQPQHERRKYLRRGESHSTLLKFAGLGRFGQATLERAGRLAEGGFMPAVEGLENGFLATRYAAGEPCGAPATAPLLDAMAAYLAFVRRTFPVPRGVAPEELVSMILVNTSEGLGSDYAARLGFLERYVAAARDATPVALDGRMLPHEWIATQDGFLKTDATDHHNDHFFPGWQDIAWDLAAAAIEFDLDAHAEVHLLARYEAAARDYCLAARLPLHRLGYLAFRVGYCTLAMQATAGTPDGARFERLRERYAAGLRQEIERHA